MATVIVQSTAILAGSGIEARTVEVQFGGAASNSLVVQQGGFSQNNIITQLSGIDSFNQILQFTGIIQDTHIVTPSQFGTTAGAQLVVFPNSFERGVFLRGVIGTSGTVESFFDRSPFFFTPSEVDPNTLRDLSEAAQFLIFSEATITTYDPFRNTPQSTVIITDKGAETSSVSDITQAITNGNFEQDFSGWTVSGTAVDATLTTVTSQPIGEGFDDSNPVVPVDGSKMAYIAVKQPDAPLILTQEFNFGTRRASSSELNSFSFSLCPDNTETFNHFQVNILFFLGPQQQANLRYRISGMDPPEQPSEVTQVPIIVNIIIGIMADVFNQVTRNIKSDLSFSTFDFDQIQTWFIFDDLGLNTDMLLDEVGLTVNVPQSQLLKTEGTAHVNTVSSPDGAAAQLAIFPFTLSGTADISQIDLSGPFFDDLTPASGTRNVSETTSLAFSVKDGGSALDQGTIDIFTDGLQIVSAGSTVTGTSFPVASKIVNAPNDIEYLFTPAPGTFVSGSTIAVSGTFADLADVSNLGVGNYSFTIVGSGSLEATISGGPDVTGPVISPTEPIDSAVSVSANTNILFRLTDDASGVDQSTVKLSLNGTTKLENDLAVDGSFSRVSNTSNGFDYNYNPADSFVFGETVTGTIEASDLAGNSSSLTYEFNVTSSDSLSIDNFFLGLDQSALVTTGTLASVCVTDLDFGVASGTTSLTVNGVVPSGLVTTFSGTATSGTAPARMTFEVPLEPLVNFREDLVFFVHAENEFPGNFPVIQEQQFTLRPGYDVTWPNKSPIGEPGAEIVFPYVTNIQVLAGVKNFAKNFGESSAFFRFLTENQHKADLGASIVSNIKTADLSAVATSVNPFFEYGKTMVLELAADDLEGNQFRLTHTFVIESKP